jgi:hypothetical protein
METDVEPNLKIMWYYIDMKESKCFFCDNKAAYFDVVQKDSEYIVADVCNSHLVMGLSS